MRLEYTQEQEQLRAEIRSTLEQVMTQERIDAINDRVEGGPEVRECVRALAAADLLGVGWPKEYGGRGFSAMEQFIFSEEAQPGQRSDPARDAQHGRTDAHAVRYRGTEAEVSAGNSRRQRRVRDRLFRARRRKRFGVIAHDRGARR